MDYIPIFFVWKHRKGHQNHEITECIVFERLNCGMTKFAAPLPPPKKIYIVLNSSPGGPYHDPHFTSKEVKAQRS